MPTIFTRIIAGEIPGQFVFKDALWTAMLDIAPAAPGHVLLVPCAEAQHLADLPAATLAALGDRLARLTATVKRATGAPASMYRRARRYSEDRSRLEVRGRGPQPDLPCPR